MYNLSNKVETRLTATSGNQQNPQIYNKYIVYEDDRNGNWEIYLYNLSNNMEMRITNLTSNQRYPGIYSNLLVYEDDRNGNLDIYAYDLSARRETRLTTNTAAQQSAEIYNNLAVWQDARGISYDIYAINTSRVDGQNVSLAINNSNSLTRFTALANWSGTNYLTIYCNDSEYSTPVQFNVVVTPVHDAPAILPIPLQTATEDLGYMFNLSAYLIDPDLLYGDSMTLSFAVPPPSGMSILYGTNISWTPNNWQVGNHSISLQVRDTHNLRGNRTFSITVINVNDAPIITNAFIPNATEGVNYLFKVNATDIDPTHDALTFTLINGPAGMAINSTGTLSWTPAHSQRAQYFYVNVNVSDSIVAVNRTYRIYVRDVTPPAITLIAPLNNSYHYGSVMLNVTTDENSTCTYQDSPVRTAWDPMLGGLNTTHIKNLTLSKTTNITHILTVRCTDRFNNFNTSQIKFYSITRQFYIGYISVVPSILYANQTTDVMVGLLSVNPLSDLDIAIARPDATFDYLTLMDFVNTTAGAFITLYYNYTATDITGNYTAFLEVNDTSGNYQNLSANFIVFNRITQEINVK